MKKYQVKVKFKNYYKSFYVDEYESPFELLKWAEKFGAKKVEFIILKQKINKEIIKRMAPPTLPKI